MVVRKIANTTLVKVLSSIQDGTHLPIEGVEYYKVKAFKLEPTSEGEVSLNFPFAIVNSQNVN